MIIAYICVISVWARAKRRSAPVSRAARLGAKIMAGMWILYGGMNVNLLTVNMEKCVKCGVCIKACPAGIVQWGELGFPEVSEKHAGRCIGCGQCVLNCPACANELSFLKESELARAEGLKLPSAEEALNLIMSRRSVRMFKDELITRETFEKLFNAVRQAPTAVNSQNVRWIVTLDPAKTKEVTNLILCWFREEIFKNPTSRAALLGAAMIAKAKEGEDRLLRGAPHVAVAVVPAEYGWPEDGAIALTYLELAAHAMGIGCCWGGYLTTAIRNFKGLREYLGIGEDEHVCGAQMMGYAAVKPARQFAPRREVRVDWIG